MFYVLLYRLYAILTYCLYVMFYLIDYISYTIHYILYTKAVSSTSSRPPVPPALTRPHTADGLPPAAAAFRTVVHIPWLDCKRGPFVHKHIHIYRYI